MTKRGWKWTNWHRLALSRHTDKETRRRARKAVLVGELVAGVLSIAGMYLIPKSTVTLILLAVGVVVLIPVLIYSLRE